MHLSLASSQDGGPREELQLSLHPGEIRKAMRQWETMAATQMSPILGQEKGPEDQKDPGTGAHSSSILADFPPVVLGSPFPGRPMTSALH